MCFPFTQLFMTYFEIAIEKDVSTSSIEATPIQSISSREQSILKMLAQSRLVVSNLLKHIPK